MILSELADPLNKELINPRLLDHPFSLDNFGGELGDLIGYGVIGITLYPRHLCRWPLITKQAVPKYPLVVVIDTEDSANYLKAVLLHELGHAKRDYPAIWDLLKETQQYAIIEKADDPSSRNPFSTSLDPDNDDPFIEYVADEFARKCLFTITKLRTHEHHP
jgi:hypothetical protein